MSVDDCVSVIGFGVAESLAAIVEKNPTGAIATLIEAAVQIIRIVGMLGDGVVNVGAGEIEPSNSLGILAL